MNRNVKACFYFHAFIQKRQSINYDLVTGLGLNMSETWEKMLLIVLQSKSEYIICIQRKDKQSTFMANYRNQ